MCPSQALSVEHAKDGIRVNAVAPGIIKVLIQIPVPLFRRTYPLDSIIIIIIIIIIKLQLVLSPLLVFIWRIRQCHGTDLLFECQQPARFF